MISGIARGRAPPPPPPPQTLAMGVRTGGGGGGGGGARDAAFEKGWVLKYKFYLEDLHRTCLLNEKKAPVVLTLSGRYRR